MNHGRVFSGMEKEVGHGNAGAYCDLISRFRFSRQLTNSLDELVETDRAFDKKVQRPESLSFNHGFVAGF